MTSEFLFRLGKTWEVTNLFLSSDFETRARACLYIQVGHSSEPCISSSLE